MLKDMLRWDLTGRITWAVLFWIFLNLLWLRFVERFVPQWVGAALATALGVALVVFGPRPVEGGEDEEEEKDGE